MIYINGKLLNIVTGETKDRETGEISQTFTAEILHQSRGKSLIDSVKIDKEVLSQWDKLIGKEISVEVRFYAMKTKEGGINSGLTLADKKSLPTVLQQKAAA